jgi:flagellar basal body-associated protein FliL
MKYTLSDKLIAYLTLISGLTISAVAIYYSVAGLVSIFAAAAIPIIVMGAVLEISKLIATVWLKINWSRAPTFIRTYLLIAIAILMLITSMGIFGFLSKAHSDAGLVSGDVQAKIAVYDEKIKTERENIDAARKALSQMDAQVNERLSRSTDDRGAERAVQIRRQQQAERTRLQNDISRSQGVIAKLNEERAPIAAEVRKVEAEVGPIKYIANFIYGDNPDTNVLEKAVTWVIIIIVIVFDPLAVILLLASQYSFQWFRQAREEEETTEGDSPTSSESEDTPTVTTDELKHEQDPNELTADQLRQINDMLAQAVVHPEPEVPVVEESKINKVDEQEIDQFLAEVDADDDESHLNEPDHVKAAKAAWKLDYPNDSLKHQRRLLEQGLINVLPWDLPPYTLTAVEDEAAVEAAKWAQEQIENSKKKVTTWLEKDGPTQIKKSVEE